MYSEKINTSKNRSTALMNTWSDDNLPKKAIPKISHLATERDTQRVEFEGFYRERERETLRRSKGGWNIWCLEQTVDMWFLEAEEWLKRKRLNE